MIEIYGDGGHSVATSLPRLASLGHITADKREIKNFPKLPTATSFIRRTLAEIMNERFEICRKIMSKKEEMK